MPSRQGDKGENDESRGVLAAATALCAAPAFAALPVGETAPAFKADSDIAAHLKGGADRTSYVIAPEGKIVFSFSDIRKPLDHVSGALAALEAWSKGHGQ